MYDHEGDVEMGDVGNVSPAQALDFFLCFRIADC